ncbi:MAG: glycosyltransferase [Eggerthellaceae bacterium]|nr:glycosyltransferase [Eggerthellaceae bacterium]
MSSAAPQLSVIVPVYNAQTYLRQALDSVARQTFEDFEVLLINDGSTDDSAAILEEYASADARFRVISKENQGYGATVNRGINEARGVYVAVFEPDDFLEPSAYHTLMQLALSASADVAKANYWFYWSKPQDRNQVISVVTEQMAAQPFSPHDIPEVVFGIPSIWSAVYRRAFLDEQGIRLLETPGASYQDLGFSFKVFSSARIIAATQEPVLHYRQDNESSSVNSPGKALCVCGEFDGIDAFIARDSSRSWLEPYAFRLRYDSYMWNFQRLEGELRTQFVERMQADLQQGVNAGAYEPRLFKPHQRKNLDVILNRPQVMLRHLPAHPSAWQKMAYYMRIGGLGTALAMVRAR